ncbi:MAG: hypothetical protein DWQ34_25560 [Planctomycetota bacterium]|nr:MAG: hypothetical protein DWQ34_25560 [Planctomycetota bacterium]REJ90408.1 MAG: hypothetical protein DWQ29_06710 [Planctomycetota bacterium]REK30006.1 MAG: hypothetical protein DWQ41_02390 [Planctomycetota bacterium]REK37751.1 MAG: hypothetical protein DWQ45_07130 [Planctomycetota bacterium]
MAATTTFEGYREQITHYAQTMALGQNGPAEAGLQAGMPADRVGMFTSGNLYKRFDKLKDACEMLAEGMEEIDDLVKAYVKEIPLSAYDTGCTDAERFLIWISEKADLTEEQKDIVRCQRSRHAVEFVAMKQRLAHVRFQELLSMNERLLDELAENGKLMVHLNPIHVWSRFETKALLDEEDIIPATVLFFPVGNDIRTVVIEPECEELIRLLDQSGVMRVKDLRKLVSAGDQEQLIGLLRDLAEMGVIALG